MFKEDWDTFDLNTTVVICSTREECNEINEHSIRRLDGRSCEYTAADTDHNGKPLRSANHEHISRYREHLPLKLGAQVILCHNTDVDGGWVNGTRSALLYAKWTILHAATKYLGSGRNLKSLGAHTASYEHSFHSN